MSKLEDMRFKAKAAANKRRMENDAADRLHELESKIRKQTETDYQRRADRKATRDEELREKYPALKDAYEQYMIVKTMCEANEPKRSGITLEELKKAFTG